jgi:hypothetical protein
MSLLLARRRRGGCGRAESGAELERNCQHPLPEWHGRQDVFDEVCGGLTHPSAQAGRAEAATLAAERHEVRLDAGGALHAREAAAEQAAVEYPSNSRLTKGGSATPSKLSATAASGGVGVERRRLRRAALVAGRGGSAESTERNCGERHGERLGRAPCQVARTLSLREARRRRVAMPRFRHGERYPASGRRAGP